MTHERDSELLTTLLERAGDPTLLLALPGGELLGANRAACRQLSLELSSHSQTTLFDLLDIPADSPLRPLLALAQDSPVLAGDRLPRRMPHGGQADCQVDLQRLTHAGQQYALATCTPEHAEQGPDVSGDPSLFLAIFDACPLPLVFASPDGVSLRINHAFARLSGFTPDEVVGRSALELGLWDDPGQREVAQGQLREQGRIDNLEATLRRKDGATLPCLLSTQLIVDNGERRIISAVRDHRSHKHAELSRQKSDALFREFFLANPVATIISEPGGTIHMVNPAFTRTTGFAAEDVVGRTAQEMNFWRDPADRERMVAAIREQGKIDHLEGCFYGKGDRPMTCLISSRAIEYAGETRILSIVIDITEQKRAEAELQRLDQAKRDFISTVAHELRTPLIAVIGYAELLETAAEIGLSVEQQREFISIIHSNGELLNRLIDDLLDVGRIQVGRSLGVQPVPTSIANLLERSVEVFRRKCPRHQFVLTHDNPLPELMQIDGERIVQVFNNLLDNAVKYSPAGGPVGIRTLTAPGELSLAITDQGIGMTADQVEFIFDRFYRADAGNGTIKGFGLGMSIVKQIVEDHGGRIAVASTPEEGTTVTLVLPV